ncbi:hypothetical protein ACFSYH_07590 [Populibacterium corticicola]|uniref:MarR family transcriptional regulator n=1 Tax=Populibacterium corticicola TaxID=1812826 RepID=A0ABW5XEM3_9MICO
MNTQPGIAEITLSDNRELISAARRELATTTVNDTETTARFVTQLGALRDFAEGMSRGIEQFTYLKTSEHAVLSTVAKDISHPRHIGRRVGMDREVVHTILIALEERGFVYVSERIGDRIIDVTVTDNGHAALAQTEAVQFRSLDALLQQAPRQDVQRLLYLLDEATELATRLAQSAIVPQS